MSAGSPVKIVLSIYTLLSRSFKSDKGKGLQTIVTHVFLYLLQSALTHCLWRGPSKKVTE